MTYNTLNWNSTRSIIESEAIVNSANNTITRIRVVQLSKDEFILLLKLSWRADEVYLSTLRSRKQPRIFKHAGRLLEYICSNYSSIKEVTICLDLETVSSFGYVPVHD